MGKLGPYELNTIVTGDARELAKGIPEESVDLVIADPPYWVDFKYKSGQRDTQMEYIEPYPFIEDMRRIARVVVVTCGIGSAGDYPNPDWIMGWFKPGSTRRSGLGGFNTFEVIYVYGKPKKRIWQDSIWLPDIANHTKGGNWHGCPKPINLWRWLIECFTDADDIVVDPVIGSGTTGVVCKELGRQWLGFEIDAATADMARQRVANTQPPLFVPEPQQLSFDTGEAHEGR